MNNLLKLAEEIIETNKSLEEMTKEIEFLRRCFGAALRKNGGTLDLSGHFNKDDEKQLFIRGLGIYHIDQNAWLNYKCEK